MDYVLHFRHRLTDDHSADSAGLLTEVDVHNLGRRRREGFITDVAQLHTRGVNVGSFTHGALTLVKLSFTHGALTLVKLSFTHRALTLVASHTGR